MTIADIPAYDRNSISRVGERAVVVGGSMAGLFAARVLADCFDHVVVVERDPLPDEPVARRGVPQSNHVHVLLEAGRLTLEDFFPGLSADLRADGGLVVDVASEFSYYDEGDFLANLEESLSLLCTSRPLLEQHVRRRIAALDAVTIRSNQRVTDILSDDAGDRVTGVTIADGEAQSATVGADLVVDATGRASRTPRWLEELGYASPPVDEVQVDVTYSTTVIERPPDDQRGFLVPPSHPRTRGATIVPVEDGRWQVTLIGVHGDEPPTDDAGFREFAASLPVGEIIHLLNARPWVGDEIHQYPFPSNRRRRYESLGAFPDGLVVVGDGIASFNPIYGQGMTVAALEALQLHHALSDSGLMDLAPRFFDRAGEILDVVWLMTVGADFQFPQTSGAKPLGTGLLNRYLARLVRQAHADAILADALARVLMLMRPPTSLFRPGIVRRVLLPKV